jgi:Ketopantoate reductase PanE/ApbA C terminal
LADMSTLESGRSLVRGAMAEIERIGLALGLGPFSGIEDRIASRAAFGPVKTSMLQDWEAGRDTELAAILSMIYTERLSRGLRCRIALCPRSPRSPDTPWRQCQHILDAHDLGGRVELAKSAIKKLSAVYG